VALGRDTRQKKIGPAYDRTDSSGDMKSQAEPGTILLQAIPDTDLTACAHQAVPCRTRTRFKQETFTLSVEWALNQNWRFKAEYLYADFGSVGTTLVTNNAFNLLSPDFMTTTTNLRVNIGRVGVNYAFGGPVVARY